MGRWDRFFEARSVSATDMLIDEVNKTLWDDLSAWPPPVEVWLDERMRTKYQAALAPDCPRPSLQVFLTALQLARWELEREYEAIDEFARNDRAGDVAGDERERLGLLFLHQWLTDTCLEILEVSTLVRSDLVEALRRLETRFLAPE